MFIAMPEGRLHIDTAGTDGSAVILLSGAGVDNARLSWKRLIPALAPRHRVVALNWPKQGLSRPWNGTADHACLLRCVETVMEHLGLGSASIVGLSQGGAITLSFGIEHPQRVDRIVAIAPAGILRFGPVIHQAMWLAAKAPWLTSALSAHMLATRRRVEKFVRTALFAGPSPDFDDVVDDILDEVDRNGAAASDWQNGSIGFSRMNIDLMPQLHRIRCPALFIQGDKDVAVPPRLTREAAGRVPDSHLVMLADHGHWPNRQSPERIASLVGDFLEGRDLHGQATPL